MVGVGCGSGSQYPLSVGIAPRPSLATIPYMSALPVAGLPSPPIDPVELAERFLGHRFVDHGLLALALTHAGSLGSMTPPEVRVRESNERLEYLGDALLGAAVAEALYLRLPQASEKTLSQIRSRLVSRELLAQAFDAGGLGPCCRLSPPTRLQMPVSVRANLMEALLAAVFLDAGWPALVRAVERCVMPLQDEAMAEDGHRQRLQTLSQQRDGRLPEYRCEQTGGSAHEPVFTATVTVGGECASGSGGSRRRAESAAAAALLARLAATDRR